jgi:hypothetical protein
MRNTSRETLGLFKCDSLFIDSRLIHRARGESLRCVKVNEVKESKRKREATLPAAKFVSARILSGRLSARPTIDSRGVTARIYGTYSYAEDDN